MLQVHQKLTRKNLPIRTSPWAWVTVGSALIVTLLVTGFVWIVPIEVIEQWSFDRAGNGSFERFEAVGKADFFVWFYRIAGLLLLVAISRICWNLPRWWTFGRDLWQGLIAVTRSGSQLDSDSSRLWPDRLRTFGCRGLLVAWGIVFMAHFGHAIGLRAHDWPYFKFHSGEVVLPNISESNRAVIRYLQQATPPDARILVASDQKLFFLSYYLRPRTLLHRMHPDSEHVIPLKDQERKLAAYRLNELTADDLAQMNHDYTLEYFEHPDLVDMSQVLSDPAWVTFLRQREGNRLLVPSYEVKLRKVEKR